MINYNELQTLTAVQVGVSIARSLSAAAGRPVHLINLPESNIIASAVSVLVNGISVAVALVLHDALAVSLIPGVLRAPRGDRLIVRRSTTWA